MKISRTVNFIIENYQNQRSFSSFLSGIAGKFGIPIWAFYVNRGQGIASFGIENKDNAILEFSPANKSYQSVPLKGFRTFIKYKDGEGIINLYEPFTKNSQKIRSRMIITPYSLIIEETNEEELFNIEVKYFILPNENFASLVRRVAVKNLSDQTRDIEILDGLPEIVPFGLSNSALKEVSQTMAAWCRVYNLENKIPFFHVKTTTDDSPEVRKMEKGHFYIAFSDKKLLTPLVDSQVIFGQDTGFQSPVEFSSNKLVDYQGKQMTENRFPAAMSAYERKVEANSSIEINSLYGHLSNEERLKEIREIVTQDDYLNKKEEECKGVHNQIVTNIYTKSSSDLFDNYCRQTYLDNLLRGGLAVNISNDDSKEIYYIYSRKHGDLERDYNYFHLEASHYSQGNGNYRDVSQNRRCDNYFNLELKDFNIKVFANLIQVDGYNPLVLKGSRYYFQLEHLSEIMNIVAEGDREYIKEKLNHDFTPGELSMFIFNNDIELSVSTEEFIAQVVNKSKSIIDANFGEGFWIDHWTYLLDLIESYLVIYPEKSEELLFEDDSYFFYDSFVKVKPRSEKYLLTDLGPRQLNAVEEIDEKRKLIEARKERQYYLRSENGKGKIYRNSLMVKLLALITNKISSLDPYGIGIEMEANKPGWYDALNGLPGIFGSSTPEVMELKRLADYLLREIDTIALDYKLDLPVELFKFINGIYKLLSCWQDQKDDHYYWDKASSLREGYREEVFYGFNGDEEGFLIADLKEYLKIISTKLDYAILRASKTDYNLYSTYYYYIPIEYKETGKVSEEGYPCIEVSKFKQVILPPFLEGQVRAMKVLEGVEIKKLHKKVKNSELFDNKLKMYRLNGDLTDMPDAIGRARAFTPGWLENGSIWLHMEYKYLLELVKNGLYDEFYQAMKDCLIPFQDPERYGRSILENSSFIMSSSNPDTDNHGRGYIARLSGSTAEFLNIWVIMAFGTQPFKMKEGDLIFKPKPILKGDFFSKSEEEIQRCPRGKMEKHIIPENSFICSLFAKVLVVYHNPDRKDTYHDTRIKSYKLTMETGEIKTIDNCELNFTYSSQLRKGEINRIDIYLQ